MQIDIRILRLDEFPEFKSFYSGSIKLGIISACPKELMIFLCVIVGVNVVLDSSEFQSWQHSPRPNEPHLTKEVEGCSSW